jgi:hypothetical protein
MNEQPALYEDEKNELRGLVISGNYLDSIDQSINPRVIELLSVMDLELPEDIARSKNPGMISDTPYALIRSNTN